VLIENRGTHKRQSDEEDDEADDASTASPSVTHEDREQPTRSEAQRHAYLKADPRIEEVRPHEVLCGQCKQWVKLRSDWKYEVRRWREHLNKCSNAQYVPSLRSSSFYRLPDHVGTDRVTASQRPNAASNS
jgi:hypothetical protein